MIKKINYEKFLRHLKLDITNNGKYNPLAFSLATGDDAVLDDLWPYTIVNSFKNNWYAASLPANMQNGMIGIDSDNGVAYVKHSAVVFPLGKAEVLDKVDTYVVTTADFEKILTMTHANAKIFTLPSIDASHIGHGIGFVKLGAGQVTIDAADNDIIRDIGASSTAGGTIYNAIDQYAFIYLRIISATEYLVVFKNSDMWITT